MSQSNFTMIRADRLGQPVLILVDTALDPKRDRASYPYLLTVGVAMHNPNQLGLCDQTESSRLDGLEDELLSVLDETEHRYLGHVTGNGSREILLYVRDPAAAIAKFERVAAHHPESPMDFVSTGDPDWSYYEQFPRQ